MTSKQKERPLNLQTESEKWEKTALKYKALAAERLEKLKAAWQSEAMLAKKLAVLEQKVKNFYGWVLYRIKK